jgi:hypothetical protein
MINKKLNLFIPSEQMDQSAPLIAAAYPLRTSLSSNRIKKQREQFSLLTNQPEELVHVKGSLGARLYKVNLVVVCVCLNLSRRNASLSF